MRIFFILTVLISSATAQEVKWGPGMELPNRNRSNIEAILGTIENNFYAFRVDYKLFGRDEYFLECYDRETMNRLWDRQLSIPYDEYPKSKLKFEDVKLLRNNIYFFYSLTNKNDGIQKSFGRLIEKNGKSPREDIELATIHSGPIDDKGAFDFIASSDSNQILIYHSRPFDFYNDEQFTYSVFDLNLNLQWAKTITLPYKDLLFDIAEYQMDPQGNIFMLSLFYPERSKNPDLSKEALMNNRYKIIAYFREENKVKEFQVSLGHKWASSVTMGFNHQGDLAVGGFYSKTGEFSIAGTFYLLIDLEKQKTVATHLKSFDREFLLKFMSEKNADKGKELSSFYFQNLISLSDTSTVFVAEKVYEVSYTYLDPRSHMMSASVTHYYNEIILVKVRKDGSIEWTIKVPKRQYSTNDEGYYSSYSMAVAGDTIRLLFNEHSKNFGNKNDDQIKFMNKPRKAEAALVNVHPDGSTNRKKLFQSKQDASILRPKMYFQDSPHSLIVFGQRSRDYQFGKITF